MQKKLYYCYFDRYSNMSHDFSGNGNFYISFTLEKKMKIDIFAASVRNKACFSTYEE